MKNACLYILVFLILTTFVTVPLAQPESDIATPVKKDEIAQSIPDLGQKEKEDWQRLREERRLARQQILTDIKANTQAEKQMMQQNISPQKMKTNENMGDPFSKENFMIKERRPKGDNPFEFNKRFPDNPSFDEPKPFDRYPGPKNFEPPLLNTKEPGKSPVLFFP